MQMLRDTLLSCGCATVILILWGLIFRRGPREHYDPSTMDRESLVKVIKDGRILLAMQAIRKQTGVSLDHALEAINAARVGDRSLLDACFEPEAHGPERHETPE
jgi:hypothetical protein